MQSGHCISEKALSITRRRRLRRALVRVYHEWNTLSTAPFMVVAKAVHTMFARLSTLRKVKAVLLATEDSSGKANYYLCAQIHGCERPLSFTPIATVMAKPFPRLLHSTFFDTPEIYVLPLAESLGLITVVGSNPERCPRRCALSDQHIHKLVKFCVWEVWHKFVLFSKHVNSKLPDWLWKSKKRHPLSFIRDCYVVD